MKRLPAVLALASTMAVTPAAAFAVEDPYYINIGQTAKITSSNAQVTELQLTVTYRCPVGASGFLDVLVNQGSAQGFGGGYVTCTGKNVRQTYTVESNFGGAGYTPGEASVNVLLVGSPQNFYSSDQIKIF